MSSNMERCIKKNDIEGINKIINKQNVNNFDEYGRGPIHYAVICDNLELTNLFISMGCSLHMMDRNAFTPIFYKTKPEITDALLKANAPINIVSKNGTTPLHEACKNNDVHKVEALLKASAKTTYKNFDGKYAKDLTKNKDILDLFEKYAKN